MKKMGMNKSFVVNSTHNWSKPVSMEARKKRADFFDKVLHRKYELEDLMCCWILIKTWYGTPFRFTPDKARSHFVNYTDEEINSAIETLMKYGFLVKVDNNTALFYMNGNETLIASMIKENA